MCADQVYARFYDLDADFEHDLAFYQQQCAGRSVLELAAGSGRVLAALARQSTELTGLDLNPAMLALAKARLGRRARWIVGDLRRPPLHQRFEAIVLAANALGLAATPHGQRACLQACQRLLTNDGRLLLDMPNPGPFLSARAPFDHERHIYTRLHPDRSCWLTRYATHRHDGLHQLVIADYRYLVTHPDGSSSQHLSNELLRYVHVQELTWLLELSGFTVDRISGWFDGRSLTADCPKLVVSAHPRS
jgi:SAM-dependent methyltransferase